MSEAPLKKLKRLVGESESIRHGALGKALEKKKRVAPKGNSLKGVKYYSDAEEREERGRMNDSQIER
jgi:hypothetical protein